MPTPEFAVLRTFREIFEGKRYKHRDSSLGDFVAGHLYEDLVTLNKSATLRGRVQAHECVVNLANRTVGKPSRRGDGTFGELVPTLIAVAEKGLQVARGEIANIQFLRFNATNVPPYPFEWADYGETVKEYGALLIRVSREYDKRFA